MALTNLSQITTSGIATLTDINLNNITGVAATFTGNVTVGGTLTYDDVTNIDSVGLITARSGIIVATGTATTALVVNGDARITGILTVGSSSLTLDGTNNVVNVGTALTLGHTQGLQFHTQNLHSQGFEINNVNATGIVTATTFIGNLTGTASNASGATGDFSIADKIVHAGDTNTAIRFPAADTITAETAGVERVRVSSDGRIGINAINNTAYDINADDVLIASDGNTGITIRSVGSTPFGMIHFADGTTGNSQKRAGRIVYQHDGDNLMFNTADTERLRITGGGNVGIGLINPEKNLVVSSSSSPTIRINNSDGSISADQTIGVIEFKANDGSGDGSQVTGSIESIAQAAFTGQGSPSHLIFKTNGVSGANALTERLRITSAGSVGIGTNNPSELLHLQSGHTKQILKSTNLNTASSVIFDVANVNTADFLLGQLTGRWNGNDVAYINFEAGADTTNKDDGIITFLTSTSSSSPTEKLRITSGGNIGINEDQPVGRVDIVGFNTSTFGIAADGTLNLAAPNGALVGRKINLNFTVVPSAVNAVGTIAFEYTNQSNFGKGDLIFGTRSVNTDTAPTERFRIASDGTIGLSIASPGARLHVHAPGSDLSTIRLSGTASGQVIYDIRQGIVGVNNAGFSIRDITNSATRFAITSAGNVGINDTAPSEKLNVGGNIMLEGDNQFMYLCNQGTGNAGIYVRGYCSGSTSGHFLRSHSTNMFTWEVTGQEKMRLTSDAKLGIGNNNPTVALDVKKATAGTIAKFYDTGSNGNALYNGGPIVALSRVSNGNVSLDGLLFQVGIDKSNSSSYNVDETIFSVTNIGVGIGTDNPNPDYLLEVDGPIRSGISGSSLPKGAGFRQHASCNAGVGNRLIYNAFDSHYAEKSFGYYFPNGQSNQALRIHSNRNSWWTCGIITINSQYSNGNAAGMLRYDFTHNANGTSSYGKTITETIRRGYTYAHFEMNGNYSFKTWGSNGGSTTSHALEIRHITSSGNSCYVTIELYGNSASTYIDDLYMTTGHTY